MTAFMAKHVFFHFLSMGNNSNTTQLQYKYKGCILEKVASVLQYCILSLRSKYMPKESSSL